MKLFDVNILIYAHRSDQRHHEYFRGKLETLLQSPGPCGLSAAVAAGFIRIVTQPKFPNGPTPLATALGVIEGLTAPGVCQWLHPGSRHWSIAAELCRSSRASGKLVADAFHAALAIEQGCTWVTRDEDFKRFVRGGLRLELWSPP